jgi:hypothetical protein
MKLSNPRGIVVEKSSASACFAFRVHILLAFSFEMAWHLVIQALVLLRRIPSERARSGTQIATTA